ncbi:MAG: hypothetical protein R2827_01810 [Bdellovibrionales bacterium]
MFLSAGCENEDPNPELRDPIYLDLKQEYDASAALLEEYEGYLKESLENSKPPFPTLPKEWLLEKILKNGSHKL